VGRLMRGGIELIEMWGMKERRRDPVPSFLKNAQRTVCK